jgi:hypothetical protein
LVGTYGRHLTERHRCKGDEQREDGSFHWSVCV